MTSTPSIDRDPAVLQPARVIIGHCPKCGSLVVVTNDHGTWPWIVCRCGHGMATTDIANRVRLERLPS